jgi:HlyD family secretion protein
MKNLLWILAAVMLLAACKGKKKTYDATGTFEAVETIVSSEASGVIQAFALEEGLTPEAGAVLGYIDSTQLYLKKVQLEKQVQALLSKRPDVSTQLAAAKEQLVQAERELKRIENLKKSDAATGKQVDDARSQVAIAQKQLQALQSGLSISTNGINKETEPLLVQITQVQDQLKKCRIINPIKGTVLTKYAEVYEMATMGKPLYKIADLDQLILRAYVTEDQFAKARLGDKVTVLTDDANGAYKEYEGTIEWLSNKAEFTPKTIQTKDERANLVYAMKVRVKNDGFLKIGMYGELVFKP